MKRNWKLIAALTLAALAVTAVVVNKTRAPTVKVAALKRGPVTDAVYATGEARAVQRAEVSPEQSGRLTEVLADAGDTVAAGAVLARVERQSLEFGRAMAQATLDRARSMLAQAQQDRGRKEALGRQGAISTAERDAARHGEEQAAADLARLESAFAIENDKVSKAEVISPMAGLVVARNTDAGGYVSSGKALFTVIDPASILIVVNVDETEVAKIREGQPVTVALDAYPGKRFAGTVERVIPLVDKSTRTAEVRIALKERPVGLAEGMSATVNVVTREIPDALIAPRDAVTATEDGAWVWTVDGGRLKKVTFVVGAGDDAGVEVVSGPLSAGALVVLAPAEDLKEGMRVRVSK